jgi:hypothetical protein
MKLFEQWDEIESDNGTRRGYTLPQAVVMQAMMDADPQAQKVFGANRKSGGAVCVDAAVFLLTFVGGPYLKKRMTRVRGLYADRLTLSVTYRQYLQACARLDGVKYNGKQALVDEIAELDRLLALPY